MRSPPLNLPPTGGVKRDGTHALEWHAGSPYRPSHGPSLDRAERNAYWGTPCLGIKIENQQEAWLIRSATILPMGQNHNPEPSPCAESVLLLEAYQAGDESALGKLMTRYSARIERIVRVRMGVFLRSRMEAEDVMQQVFLRAIRDIGQFEPREDASLINWLARLAENELANLAREQKAQRRDARRELALARLVKSGLDSSLAFDLSSGDPRVDSQVANKQMEEVLDECIGELKEDYREVILLRNHAGGSWSWICDQLDGASPDAARKLHARAMIELTDKVHGRT
jgi:RNA polymerase sigma factor (sigma-70 family)